MTKEYYTVKEAAELLEVSEGTIRRWIKEEIIPATQKMRKGAIRIHKLDIPTYKREEANEPNNSV